MKDYKEFTIKLNIEHVDMFCQNSKEETEKILSKDYGKFLTFYCHIMHDGKEVGSQTISFSNYNEKDSNSPDELAIHIFDIEENDKETHTFTMLPKWEKERLREFLM